MYGIVSQLIELVSPPLLLLNAQFNILISLRFYYVLILNFFPGLLSSVSDRIIQFTLCTWMWCFFNIFFLFTCVICVRINDDDGWWKGILFVDRRSRSQKSMPVAAAVRHYELCPAWVWYGQLIFNVLSREVGCGTLQRMSDPSKTFLTKQCVCVHWRYITTSVACKTWACVHMCSSGDLRATKHHNYFRHGYVCLFISRITHKKTTHWFSQNSVERWRKKRSYFSLLTMYSRSNLAAALRRKSVSKNQREKNAFQGPRTKAGLWVTPQWIVHSPRCIWLLHISSVSADGIHHPHQRNAYNTAPWNH